MQRAARPRPLAWRRIPPPNLRLSRSRRDRARTFRHGAGRWQAIQPRGQDGWRFPDDQPKVIITPRRWRRILSDTGMYFMHVFATTRGW